MSGMLTPKRRQKSARDYSGRAANQPQKLVGIQRVMTNNAAIEQQDRHLEAELPGEVGIGVDINDGDGRHGSIAFELRQPMQHFLAKATTFAAQDHEAPGNHVGITCGVAPDRALRPLGLRRPGAWRL